MRTLSFDALYSRWRYRDAALNTYLLPRYCQLKAAAPAANLLYQGW